MPISPQSALSVWSSIYTGKKKIVDERKQDGKAEIQAGTLSASSIETARILYRLHFFQKPLIDEGYACVLDH
jgi:hypothetical protein